MIDPDFIHKTLSILALFVIILLVLDAKIYRRNMKRDHDEQIENLRVAIMEDNRWMASNTIASRLTQRYLDILADDWRTKVIESSDKVREELDIDPRYTDKKWIVISPDGKRLEGHSVTDLSVNASRDFIARKNAKGKF